VLKGFMDTMTLGRLKGIEIKMKLLAGGCCLSEKFLGPVQNIT
jgi:hypothetical protein